MKRNFLWALVGLLAGLFVMERERRKELSALVKSGDIVKSSSATVATPASSQSTGQDRTPEDMSEYYRTRRMYLTDYDPLEVAEHIDRIALELIQPNMTPAEAMRVANVMSELARGATVYDSGRKIDARRDRKKRSDDWIDDIDLGEDK